MHAIGVEAGRVCRERGQKVHAELPGLQLQLDSGSNGRLGWGIPSRLVPDSRRHDVKNSVRLQSAEIAENKKVIFKLYSGKLRNLCRVKDFVPEQDKKVQNLSKTERLSSKNHSNLTAKYVQRS
jgi:hypothetical protein